MAVYACELPLHEPPAEDATGVYACPLPDSGERRGWWRRLQRLVLTARQRRAAFTTAPLPDELIAAQLSRERWEETASRLRVVTEAFRAAEAAKACGEHGTAAQLRSLAAACSDGSAVAPDAAAAAVRALSRGEALPAAALPGVVEVEVLRSVAGEPGCAQIWARVDVAAPAELVWRTLTDYERLGDIVPSLDENRVLQRWPGGARLRQGSAQELGFGLRFSAAATLDIEELPQGIAKSAEAEAPGARLVPRSPGPPPASVRDICFRLVESRDLRLFSGTWRIEARAARAARLLYAARVLPQPWLPVGLIADRVGRDIRGNLAAVAKYAEALGQGAVELRAADLQ